MEKNFIQCSLKVSFPGPTNPKQYKNPNKITSFKVRDFW